jgi:flagellar motor switch protein FliN/FliY
MKNNEEPTPITTTTFGELPPQSDFDGRSHLLAGRLDLLKDVNVMLDTRVGQCELSVAALSQLKNGEVLTLDRAPDEPIDIMLGGTVVAKGRLVVVGEYFGVRIEDIAELTL